MHFQLFFGGCFFSALMCKKAAIKPIFFYMKNYVVYNKLKVQVDNIIEVRLSYAIWNRIKWTAICNNRSYSWVVRLAVFRFIKRRNVAQYYKGENTLVNRKYMKMNDIANMEKTNCQEKHRHKLCLYGKDELYIRLCAIQLECSMSHLIRIALFYYFNDKFSDFFLRPVYNRFKFGEWYWFGIKMFADVQFPTRGNFIKYFMFIKYKKEDYW